EPVGQRIQVVAELVVIEPRTAVQQHERITIATFFDEEPRIPDRYMVPVSH
ncbi:MAG: hypothetical protein QOD46_180, partial [Actinomycetota bacterium]|nr:hypothetical protein [Actinomycetota bacterium]